MIKTLDKVEETTYWTILLYGAAGVGKTVTAATSQRFRTTLLDVDSGINSVKAYYKKNSQLTLKPKVAVINSILDFTNDFNTALASDAELIVIDTVSELQRAYVRYYEKAGNNGLAVWGETLDNLEQVSEELRKAKKHSIFLAHENLFKDIYQDVKYAPHFQGSYKNSYSKHFDIIGRFAYDVDDVVEKNKRIVKVTRQIDFSPSPLFISKDRSMALGIEDADIDKIFSKILISNKEETQQHGTQSTKQ